MIRPATNKRAIPDLDTTGLRAWAVISVTGGALRMRAAGESSDDWQAKIYSTKVIALKYAWPDEAVVPVNIVQRPGKKKRGS